MRGYQTYNMRASLFHVALERTFQLKTSAVSHHKQSRLSLLLITSMLRIVLTPAGAMGSLLAQKPGLAHLDLDSNWMQWNLKPWLPIVEYLTAFSSPWSDSLASLELNHVVMIPDFFSNASKTIWPHMRTIKLVGMADTTELETHIAYPVMAKNCSDLFGALAMAMPSMPKATKFEVTTQFSMDEADALKFQMHLGNIPRSEKAAPISPCGSKFLPTSNNGTAKVDGIDLPGELATQLQDAVWLHRRQEFGVSCCTEEWPRHHFCHPCVEWNRRTGTWDSAFTNDMDELIFNMGQYLDWMNLGDDEW